MSKKFNLMSIIDPIGSLAMGGLSGDKKKKDAPIAPAPAAAKPKEPEGPTAEEQAAAKAEEDKKKKVAAQGAGGTILTGSLGVQDETASGKKTLLGA